MKLTNLTINLPKQEQDGACDHLLGLNIPDISLPTQNDILLKLNRTDTFRIVFFCYPMTGRPDQPLPENWDMITGAKGCTQQNCSFRDNYDNLIKANALPIGISTQSITDIKEMTLRLQIPYDIVSDQELVFTNLIQLPTFSILSKKYIKRLTMIVEKSIIKKVFYPVLTPDKHIEEVLKWLKNN